VPLGQRFWLLRKLRRKTRGARFERFKTFAQEIRSASGDNNRVLRVLDLGGTLMFWETWWKITPEDRLHVTLLNDYKLHDNEKTRQSGGGLIDNVCQDATTLTPTDLSQYDIIFANSFLEHLKSREAQKGLAKMISTSGMPYFIQVPNKFSPIDPHRPYLPFFALYPSGIRSRIGPGPGSKVLENGRRWKMDYNPLGLSDMQEFFPTANFKVEKPLGVPMSILAYQISPSAKTVLA
jgi:hypothetical protein